MNFPPPCNNNAVITELTVVFVEDAVDDRVATAGDEDKHLRGGVGVDERPLDAR